ncbi:8605_t:CDS:10 [Entrophospora sp. SA101]|nr:8605_t:CDS:10 [Entrophospora sp. SA101]
MFKKPISNIKQYSLLRASDRRKLKDKLISSFQTLEAFEQKNKDVENKDDASAIILPEQIQSVKITTHSGINGVLYVTQEKHPIWLTLDIDKEEILVPTVYTLWKFPDILPKIPTFRIVVDKLVGGANLMIPGIAYPPEKLPNVKIDEIVAITIQGHNYPVGIGIMKVETSSLERGSKKKGLAVQIIHMYKDYLWDMGDKSLPSDSNDQVAAEYDEYDAAIDEILQASLYQALLEKLTPKETLPISGSKLYDSYLLPCRPIGTEDTVDIKKSSHKNLTKFLKAIEKKGVIKLRARKGEILLDSVNWEHDELTTFRSHKSIEKSSNVTTTGSNSEIQKIQIVEVFKPRDAVYNVYEYKELKNVVSGYVKTKNLSDRENRKFIILDELLRSIFAEKTGVAAPDKLAYNDLVYNIGKMFKKPISNIKQYSLLRASDRRKLKDKLISSFQTLEAFEQKNKDVENKDDASAIILPEQIQSVKITTHSGINGVLYVTQEKHPIWLTLDIDKEEILVPTVYTLWKFPDILPKIPTFRIVVDKLVGGANLMIPGIAYPPEKLPNVKIDEIVAITIQGHNYPVGIGIMKVETSSLERGSKKKGLAVQIIHMYKDYLWDMGDKSLPSDSNDQVAAEYDEYDAAIDEILQASLYQALLEKLTPKETLPIQDFFIIMLNIL